MDIETFVNAYFDTRDNEFGDIRNVRHDLDAIIAAAVRAEREACVKVAEDAAPLVNGMPAGALVTQAVIAAAIRARNGSK